MSIRGWWTGIAMCIGMTGSLNAQVAADRQPLAADTAVSESASLVRPVDSVHMDSRVPSTPISQRLAVQRAHADLALTPPSMAGAYAQLRQPRALMIVGSAAFLAGAIIGGTSGTLIMVGGTVTGLYGLYKYVQ